MILISKRIPHHIYDRILRNSLHYAVLSYPFTSQLVEWRFIKKKIHRIAKGHFARSMFHYLAEQSLWPIQFSDKKPFYQAKRYDFEALDLEWHIVHQFINHPPLQLSAAQYAKLPAMIPNRYLGDLWDRRNQVYQEGMKASAFMFSFMRENEVYNRNRSYFDFSLMPDHIIFLKELRHAYGNERLKEQPFDPQWFWDEMDQRGGPVGLTVYRRPPLVLSAIASTRQYPLFHAEQATFQDYEKGILYSVIPNYQCLVKELPSFHDLLSQHGWQTSLWQSVT